MSTGLKTVLEESVSKDTLMYVEHNLAFSVTSELGLNDGTCFYLYARYSSHLQATRDHLFAALAFPVGLMQAALYWFYNGEVSLSLTFFLSTLYQLSFWS